MKLRRAMAVAAATAVIAPAAFLAAPAAYATDGTTAATSSGTTGESGDTTDPNAPTGPGDDTDTSTGETPKTDDTNTSTGETPKTDDTTTSTGETPKTDDTKPAEGDTPKPGGDTTPATGGTGKDEGKDELPYCEDLDEKFEEKALDVKLTGLPGKIVAGSGWKNFNLTITNKSKTDLKEVAFYAEVENDEIDESKWLSQYVKLEFKVPGTNEWAPIGDEEWAGDYFWGVDTMKSQDFVKIDLRLNVAKNAPAGDSYSFGSGGYIGDVDGKECIAENAGAYVDFVVLKPGSSNDNPGEAKPGDEKPGKSGPGTKPQGGVKELPVTGNLAETGSSSMLPTIGIAGGIAIVAGAGVVFALKRRSGGAVA
ncbi:hypothetical protein [Streptomyces sp. NPDC047928]|uniref:hypothetical protein n=1 Tax=unclassified Streptomyces TaxID=2593676 RepID=UPI003723FFE7